jgi:hypothetical protein
MELQKGNAGNRISDTGTDKGHETFRDNYTDTVLEIAKWLKEQRLRRDNAALRLPPLYCGCHDPLRCRCFGRAA